MPYDPGTNVYTDASNWANSLAPDIVTAENANHGLPAGALSGIVDGTTYPGLGTQSSPAKITMDETGLHSDRDPSFQANMIAAGLLTKSGSTPNLTMRFPVGKVRVCGNYTVQSLDTTLVKSQDLAALSGAKLQVVSNNGFPGGGGTLKVGSPTNDGRGVGLGHYSAAFSDLAYTGKTSVATTVSGDQTLTVGGNLVVVDASGLEASGYVSANGNSVQYASKSGNTLQNITPEPAAIGVKVKDTKTVRQDYMTGCSGGTGVFGIGQNVKFLVTVNNQAGDLIEVVEPRAFGFVYKQTTLDGQQDLNNLGGVTPAAVASKVTPKLTLTAIGRGTLYNSIQIEFVASGLNTPLSVVVVKTISGWGPDRKITVNLKTDGSGAPISTPTEVKNALDASTANQLVTTAVTDSTGTVAALALASLTGGADGDLAIVDSTGFDASGICQVGQYAIEYQSIDTSGGAGHHKLRNVRFAYISNSSGGYFGPPLTVPVGQTSPYIMGAATKVLRIPAAPFGPSAATNWGRVTFSHVTGTGPYVVQRYPSNQPAMSFQRIWNFDLPIWIVFGSSNGDLFHAGGFSYNLQINTVRGYLQFHPRAELGAKGVHIDLGQITHCYNEANKVFFNQTYFSIGRSGNPFVNESGSAPDSSVFQLFYDDCVFGIVLAKDDTNTFDLHNCHSVGARRGHWDKTISLDDGAASTSRPFIISAKNVSDPLDPTNPTMNWINPTGADKNLWDDGTQIPGPYNDFGSPPPPPPPPPPDEGTTYVLRHA